MSADLKLAAAEGSAARDDHSARSISLEGACRFGEAAAEALRAGQPARAVLLAATTGDDALAREAMGALRATPASGASAASELRARGFHRYAGELLELLGEPLEAAHAFTEGNDALRAAACFERSGRPADAARVLEATLRASPADARARLALAHLLAAHARYEALVRTLQALPDDAPERGAALPLLAAGLERLGYHQAARGVREEAAALGVDPHTRVEPGHTGGPEGKLLFGRYEVVREIAASPHARLLEAIDRVNDERVALKLLAPSSDPTGRDALARFHREAAALQKIRHPCVVPLREFLPEQLALVLTWMDGGSLAERSREGVSPARAVEIACAVLSALAEAHRVGVLHRDVKPSNVLFDAAGAARLADFGVARLDDGSRTATAGAIGTLAYMAPEQRDGRPASTASDVYGAGVLLAELLTGVRRLGSSAAEPRARPSERNPDLGPAHDAIVARLCAEDPDDRPSALEARRALEALGWPDRVAVAPARVEPSEAAAAVRPVTRFEALGGGRFRDAWLGREVLAIPLDDASLALARALARAGHPALPSILEADLDAGTIWIAAARGPSLTEAPRALSAAEVARLRDAITALHAAGGGHGSLDAAHLHGAAGDLQLAYPALPADARAAERDRAALAALEAAASPCADRAASC